MKILEIGKSDFWETEQICTGRGNGNGGCGAKLLVAETDIYITKSLSIEDNIFTDYTFKCPCCSKETDIPKRKIPRSVRRNIMKK